MAVKSVEEYISSHPSWENEIRKLRTLVLSTEAEETIKWGAPVYTWSGKNIVGIGAFKNHCALWFFQGALLKDNIALLENAQEGKTKALRQIRFKRGEEIPDKTIRKYVVEAIQNQKEGKEIKPIREQKVEIPDVLNTAMERDPSLGTAFYALTPGKQREYCTYLKEAKREATKQGRMEKISPLIKDGKGLHDQYKNC